MLKLETILFIAGCLHFAVLIASALVPGTLDWRNELARLSTLTRQLVWVHGVFIVLVITGFGAITIVNAHALLDGSTLSRSVCGFIALFWGARVSLQFLLFDTRPYVTNRLLRMGHHGLTILFGYFTVIYAWAALWPAHEIPMR